MTGNESEIEEELTQSMYNQREEGMVHLPYRQEMSFYELVKNLVMLRLSDLGFSCVHSVSHLLFTESEGYNSPSYLSHSFGN